MGKKEDSVLGLKKELTKKLADEGFLWSYKMEDGAVLSDDELIETSLVHLEFEDMYLLFSTFPFRKIKQVWIELLIPRNDYYGILNKLLALLFFNIKKPDNYILKHMEGGIKKSKKGLGL